MHEELKLCPRCGETKSLFFYVYPTIGAFTVLCDNCGMRGPAAGCSKDEAIRAWNTLPRRLPWTQEKPTVEGMYWCRCIDPCRRIAGPANIMYYTPGCTLVDMYDEFAGPIQEPEEP